MGSTFFRHISEFSPLKSAIFWCHPRIFAPIQPSFTTERQKLRPFVSKYLPRFPTLKAVFRSICKWHIHTRYPHETLLLQSRNTVSTNKLAQSAVVKMSIALRQKLFFEPAKISIISHTTKQLRNFSVESGEFRVER